jgi:hypothetical protein
MVVAPIVELPPVEDLVPGLAEEAAEPLHLEPDLEEETRADGGSGVAREVHGSVQ